jgi:hypothetical protein
MLISALGTYLLVRYLTRCRLSAFLAGIIFGFHPLHFFLFPQITYVSIQWIPFTAFFLLRWIKEGRRRDIVYTAIFSALATYCSYHEVIYLSIFSCLVIAYALLFERSKILTDRTIGGLALIGILYFLIVSPVVYPMIRGLIEGKGELLYTTPTDRGISQVLGLNYFYKGYGVFLFWPVILGYLSLTLMAVTLFKGERKSIYFWWIVFLVFLVLSFDSTLHLFTFSYPQIPMPMALLYKLPIFKAMRYPFKFLFMVLLPVSVLAGMGLKQILASFSPGTSQSAKIRRIVIAISISMLVFLEYLHIPLESIEVKVPGFYEMVQAEKGDFGIIEVPLFHWPEWDSWYQYFQTYHEKKITSASLSRNLTTEISTFIKETPFFSLAMNLGSVQSPDVPDSLRDVYIENLQENNIRYLVFNKWIFHPKTDFQPMKLDRKELLKVGVIPYSLNSRFHRFRCSFMDFKHSRGTKFRTEGWNEVVINSFFRSVFQCEPIYEDESHVVYRIPLPGVVDDS